MAKISSTSTVLLLLMVITALTSFRSRHLSPLMDKIPGRYSIYFPPDANGNRDYSLLNVKKHGDGAQEQCT